MFLYHQGYTLPLGDKNLFAKPNEQNDACIKSAMARMPKASRRLSLAVGEAGANKQRKSESEAAMPKASRTEAALSPEGEQCSLWESRKLLKGRGADSGGESEAAKGGCEGTNPLSETMQECMQKTF